MKLKQISFVTLTFGLLLAPIAGQAQSLSQCGGDNYLVLRGPDPGGQNEDIPLGGEAETFATATDTACQSDSINSSTSLVTLTLMQSLAASASDRGLWALGNRENVNFSGEGSGDGDSDFYAAGIDYNFGNQSSISFGAGLAGFDTAQSAAETRNYAGRRSGSRGTGAIAYIDYVKTLSSADVIDFNLSASYFKLDAYSETSLGEFGFRDESDGTSSGVNASVQYQHRFRDSNSMLVALAGIGAVRNEFNNSAIHDRDDRFLYGTLGYILDVSEHLTLSLEGQLQNAGTDFSYNARTSLSDEIFYVTNGGTMLSLVAGASVALDPKWSATVSVGTHRGEDYESNSLFLLFRRSFGNR
ncbi:hypothetical protein [Asticcacaulis biprosthecium]|nr:hypothetical protein [Asticcacaulis biprosthecium]